MKIAFTTFACPEWSLRQIVRAATKHQYNGIEFRCDADHAHGVEVWASQYERKSFREEIQKADLEIACLSTSMQFIEGPEMARTTERLQLAADIGAPGVRVFCGPLPEYARHPREAMERLAGHLNEAAVAADVLGVDLWLETHDSASRGADAAFAVRSAAHPRVGICYDNLHPVRKGEPVEATMAHLAGLIRHVHLHDGLNQPDQVVITPMGQGQMPIDETVLLLINQGYTGYLCGEWFHQQYGANPDDALELYSHEVRTLLLRHGVKVGF